MHSSRSICLTLNMCVCVCDFSLVLLLYVSLLFFNPVHLASPSLLTETIPIRVTDTHVTKYRGHLSYCSLSGIWYFWPFFPLKYSLLFPKHYALRTSLCLLSLPCWPSPQLGPCWDHRVPWVCLKPSSLPSIHLGLDFTHIFLFEDLLLHNKLFQI